MALARIITNSHVCSRELALNLLERGYVVEIVSPDAIPDNFADLELRVETGPADFLSASVEVREAAQTTRLQFVHQLKPPSLEVKRAPMVDEAIAVPDVIIPALAISANPLPARMAREPIPISMAAAPIAMPEVGEKPEVRIAPAARASSAVSAEPPKKPAAFCEGTSALALPSQPLGSTKAIASPEPQLVLEPAPLTDFKADAPDEAVSPVIRFVVRKPALSSLTMPWPNIPKLDLSNWRAFLTSRVNLLRQATVPQIRGLGWTALSFVAMITFALALSLGSRRAGNLAAESARDTAKSGHNSPADAFSLLAPDTNSSVNTASQANVKPSALLKAGINEPSVGQPASLAVPSSENTTQQIAAVGHQGASPHKSRTKPSLAAKARKHSEDVIAPDTTIYFNRPDAKPVSAR